MSDQRITATVAEFCRLSGLGRDTVFKMMRDGRLDRIKIGTRTLIVIASYHRLIEAQRLSAHVRNRPPQTPVERG